LILEELQSVKQLANKRISERIDAHLEFVKKYQAKKKELKYTNKNHGFSVMTRQEQDLKIDYVDAVHCENESCITVNNNTLKLLNNPPGETLFKNE
jgi:hypothetical protein